MDRSGTWVCMWTDLVLGYTRISLVTRSGEMDLDPGFTVVSWCFNLWQWAWDPSLHGQT